MKRTLLLSLLLCLVLQTSKAQTKISFFTTMGVFVVEMADSLKPITAGNFIDLADSGFYDGIIFHRVIQGFVVQGGDPLGTGYGGPGYTIQDEFDTTGTLSNVEGTISMANTGQPNSGGSQFFFNLVDNTQLDWDQAPFTSAHPVFGAVWYGWDKVLEIGDVETYTNGKPKTDVVMDSLRRFQASDTIPIDTTNTDTNANDTTPAGVSSSVDNAFRARLFPNPASEESVLSLHSGEAQEASVTIIDPLGRVIKSVSIQLRGGTNRISSIIEHDGKLSPGVYQMKIVHRHGTESISFIQDL